MGVLGYLVFPWYAQQDANGLLAVGQVFSSEQAANGLMQAALFGRPWLWLGLAGLVVAGLGACLPLGGGGGMGLVILVTSSDGYMENWEYLFEGATN